MNLQVIDGLFPGFTHSDAARKGSAPAVVPMYTPLWYATRVMAVTANSWWEGGVPPARRGQRAARAVAQATAGVARRLHEVGHPARP